MWHCAPLISSASEWPALCEKTYHWLFVEFSDLCVKKVPLSFKRQDTVLCVCTLLQTAFLTISHNLHPFHQVWRRLLAEEMRIVGCSVAYSDEHRTAVGSLRGGQLSSSHSSNKSLFQMLKCSELWLN